MISLIGRVTLAMFLAALALPAGAQQRQMLTAPPPEPGKTSPQVQRAAVFTAAPLGVAPPASPKTLLAGVPFASVGFPGGFRLSNLGGRREVYVPVPQGVMLNLADLVLVYDDISAHDARRSLEILVNDRAVAALPLDGKSTGRTVRIQLANASPRQGFLKLSFLYSGAATQDRCIDVRYVGDSMTVRAESAVEFEIGTKGEPNILATAALMPNNVAVLLSNPVPPAADIAAALTLARSLTATGRQVTFYHGLDAMPEMVDGGDKRRWSRGLVVVGAFGRIASRLDPPVATLVSATGPATIDSTLATARIGGVPILLVSDSASAHLGRLLDNASLLALRDTSLASVGPLAAPKRPVGRVSFDSLGLGPAPAEVFGRADIAVSVPSNALPSGTKPSRLALDFMVAPDGNGEKAVLSVFVNERLLASTVASVGEPTRLDLPLPEGLVGSVANIRTVIQRRSLQGDCRSEPQGFPVQMLSSSSVILSAADPVARDFSDLATLWANGVEILVPPSTSARPLGILTALSDILAGLSKETAPIVVKYVESGSPSSPGAPFIAVSGVPPEGAEQRMRFDRGRVAVTDRAGLTLLDLGGLTTGAVAQIVTSNGYSGLWIKPLSSDGSLPAPPAINLDRGDVAFLDRSGVALALSTERDTLLRITYADNESWFGKLDRFRSWIVGGIWVILTFALLFGLQRVNRRRAATGE